jgi:hypothetical protein
MNRKLHPIKDILYPLYCECIQESMAPWDISDRATMVLLRIMYYVKYGKSGSRDIKSTIYECLRID